MVATPIGNLGDMTQRAVEVLRSVDAIAAEDTRRTRKLLSHFDIHTRLVSFHEHSEERIAPSIVRRVEEGDDVALVSDSGTPLIADPGYRLVALALDRGLDVVAVPGPAAVVAALSISGLPPQPFCFVGFLPRRPGPRRKRLASVRGLPGTIVVYESPHRIVRSLRDMADVLGDRPAALVREMTKIHEEVVRGRLPVLAEAAPERSWKGEIVVLIGPAQAPPDEGGGPP